MRILHVSTRLILGGSQENTVLSCEGQARLGHDVHLAFGPIYGPEGSMLDRVRASETDDGRTITTHEVPDLVREVSPRRDRRCLAQLEKLIRTVEPDIVHTHSSKAGVLGRLAAWRVHRSNPARTPAVIHTIHGPPFMPIEGSPLARAKVRAKNHIYTIAERRAARACHRIVSVADAMTEQFLAHGIGEPGLYTTVRSGMDTAPYLEPEPTREAVRAELDIDDEDFVVGTVARLAQHKGHDDLLDALGEDMRADPRLKLLWVGDGWWRDRLMERVAALGVEGQVLAVGLVPPERVPVLLRAMDVLAHPSYREGLPRTVPQALLSGVLPIATDTDGTGEVCREMETGRLVPVGDAAALREAVRWARAQPDEAHALAARGREECRVAFSAETMVGGLERVYADALRRAGGASGERDAGTGPAS